MQVPIGISNRHIHLTEADAKALFGEDHQFTKLKDLSQTGKFALQETVSIQGPEGKIDNVRILGPRRSATQIEIMASDQYILGTQAKTRISGDLENTTGLTLIGPKAEVKIEKGLIIAQRHLHASQAQATKLGLIHKQNIAIKTAGDRAITFHNVIVRIEEGFDLDFHIDFDEANAGSIKAGDTGEAIR